MVGCKLRQECCPASRSAALISGAAAIFWAIGYGVFIGQGTAVNVIGGMAAGAGNLISAIPIMVCMWMLITSSAREFCWHQCCRFPGRA